MKNYLTLIVVAVVLSSSSCTVKESIVFKADGSGSFLVSYDMSKMIEQMGDAFKETEDNNFDDTYETKAVDSIDTENIKEKKPGVLVDSTIYFSEIIESNKDSVATLSKDKRMALKAVKDMYMTIKTDEDNGIFEMGIGLKFNSIKDLKDIQKKIEHAKSLNSQSGELDQMSKNSSMKHLTGNGDNDVTYSLTETDFSRTTTLAEPEPGEKDPFESMDENDRDFKESFEKAYYIVEYTFPKQIKSASIEGAIISDDRKTITYKMNWIEYLMNPKGIDIKIEFENE